MNAKMTGPNVYTVSYSRESDGKLWRYLCKVEGAEVLWATLYDDGKVGRWRNNYSQGDTKFIASSKSASSDEVQVCTQGKSRCLTVNRVSSSHKKVEKIIQKNNLSSSQYAAACKAVISGEFGDDPNKLVSEEQYLISVHLISSNNKSYYCDANASGYVAWMPDTQDYNDRTWRKKSWVISKVTSKEATVCKKKRCIKADVR